MIQPYIGKILMTTFISAVPVLELRGAIPYGVAQGLDIYTSIIASIIGNIIPIPFIIIFTRSVFAFIRKRISFLDKYVTIMENRSLKKAELVHKYEFWGLVFLVAIPLPGTGAWTGSMVAAILNLRLKYACPAVILGVVIAAIIVAVLTYGFTILI